METDDQKPVVRYILSNKKLLTNILDTIYYIQSRREVNVLSNLTETQKIIVQLKKTFNKSEIAREMKTTFSAVNFWDTGVFEANSDNMEKLKELLKNGKVNTA